MHAQLDTANAQLADTNRQIELLTEQIRIMNQRQFGRHSESGLIEGQIILFIVQLKYQKLQRAIPKVA